MRKNRSKRRNTTHQTTQTTYLDEPVHQDGAHALVDVGLGLHVGGADRGDDFALAVVLVHVQDVLGGAEGIFLVAGVDIVRGAGDLVRVGVRHGASARKDLAGRGSSSDGGAGAGGGRKDDFVVVGVSDGHGAGLDAVGALGYHGLAVLSVGAIAGVGVRDILRGEKERKDGKRRKR